MSLVRATPLLVISIAAVLMAACSDRAGSNEVAAEPQDSTIATTPPVTALTEPRSEIGDVPTSSEMPERTPDVIYVPTPPEVVDAMLTLAEVRKGDVLYDLGSGDGRIPIAAAKAHGVRGTGIDIDPQRIREANQNARDAGVTELVTFKQADLFQSDFSDATVVTLYLLDSLNEKLRPKLLAELKPGTRIVSHAFRMGDWEPEQIVEVGPQTIYRWTIPERK